jgi:hypothetical protein
MWLVRTHGIGNWACLLGFDLNAQLLEIFWLWETNLIKNDFWEPIAYQPFMNGLIWLWDDVWMVVEWGIWCLWSYVVFVPLFGL